jgi:hypothetical protein
MPTLAQIWDAYQATGHIDESGWLVDLAEINSFLAPYGYFSPRHLNWRAISDPVGYVRALSAGAAPIDDPNFGVLFPLSPNPLDALAANALTHSTGRSPLARWGHMFSDTRAFWLMLLGGAAAAAAGGAGAAAGAAEGAIAAESAVVATEGAVIVAEAAPLTASEFSLAGTGSGVGIGGQSYGLGLQMAPLVAEPGFSLAGIGSGLGLQFPAGAALDLAPALTNPLTYSPLAAPGMSVADVMKQAETLKAAVKPLLALGSAVRGALVGEGDAPARGAPGPVTPADTFASDLVWTLGTLAAAVAALFVFSKL